MQLSKRKFIKNSLLSTGILLAACKFNWLKKLEKNPLEQNKKLGEKLM